MHNAYILSYTPGYTELAVFPCIEMVAIIRTHCADTHTHTQPFYGSMDFVRDNPREPVPEETFTHSHLSWSLCLPIVIVIVILGCDRHSAACLALVVV